MSSIDVNQNIAQCLKTSTNWGHEVVYNICNGTQTIVPWGTVDWSFAVGVSVVGVLVILVFIGSAISVLT